jgi:hypothetical protein
MQRRIALFISQIVISALTLSYSFTAKAANYEVTVDFFGLTPDPVNIKEGDSVFWIDGDGGGPYTIYFNGGLVQVETPNGLTFGLAGTYYYFDDLGDYGTVNVSPNSPPFITITNPTNNTVFVAPAAFSFAADVVDPDPSDVAGVEFYVGGQLVDFVSSPPFDTPITNLTAGAYELKAIAYDYSNASATNKISITVVNPGPITLTASALGSNFRFTANGLVPGKLTVVQTSTDLKSASAWNSLSTNAAAASTQSFTNPITAGSHFYRVIQLP